MIYILAIAFVLGILIFVHELGHFLVAKLSGVMVLKFSLGFGPKLIGKRIGDTDYMISAFPLGGYVKLFGDNPREKVAKKEERSSFLHQSVPKRMAIVAAGPLANFFLAVFIFSLLLWIGVPQPSSVVGGVSEGTPAHQVGIQPGDKIVQVNDNKITYWSDLLVSIPKSEGRELQMTIQRGKKIFTVGITPRAVTVQNIFGE